MLTGILAGLGAGALWGLVFVAPRLTPGLSAVDLTAGRFISFGAVSALAMLLALRTRRLPTLQQAATALGLSVLGFNGFYLMLVLAIRDAGTEVPTLIIGTIPIWMMLLGKPLGLRWKSLAPGLLLTSIGLGLMMIASGQASSLESGQPGNLAQAIQPNHFWRGIASAVASMVCWTAFGLLNSAWLKRHPEVRATDWANWLGCATGLGAIVLWFLLGTESKVLFAHVDIQYLAIICIATGISSAWLAIILWNLASQRLSASLSGQLIVSETVFALVYSYALDGQWPRWIEGLACVLFVLGILATIRAHGVQSPSATGPRNDQTTRDTR